MIFLDKPLYGLFPTSFLQVGMFVFAKVTKKLSVFQLINFRKEAFKYLSTV